MSVFNLCAKSFGAKTSVSRSESDHRYRSIKLVNDLTYFVWYISFLRIKSCFKQNIKRKKKPTSAGTVFSWGDLCYPFLACKRSMGLSETELTKVSILSLTRLVGNVLFVGLVSCSVVVPCSSLCTLHSGSFTACCTIRHGAQQLQL